MVNRDSRKLNRTFISESLFPGWGRRGRGRGGDPKEKHVKEEVSNCELTQAGGKAAQNSLLPLSIFYSCPPSSDR